MHDPLWERVRVAAAAVVLIRADKSSGCLDSRALWVQEVLPGHCGECGQQSPAQPGSAGATPAALLLCLAPGQPGGRLWSCCRSGSASQLPPSLPGLVALPRVPVTGGGISHTAQHSNPSPANLELSVAACPASLVLPSQEYVRGLLLLSGCGAARTFCAHTPAHAASALPWPLPHRLGLWVSSRASREGTGCGNTNATCWAVVWAHPWVWAALTAEQLGCPCRACGQETGESWAASRLS